MSGRRETASRIARAVEGVPLVGPRAAATGRATARRLRPRDGDPAGATDTGHPTSFVVSPRPGPLPTAWPEPPAIDRPLTIVGDAPDEYALPTTRYDIDLFEALNAEYAAHPLVPEPQRYDDAALLERARARLGAVHRSIDLRGKRVLEFGCGGGYEIWQLSHAFQAQGWGVDIAERRSWASLADERTRFTRADLAVDRPFAADSFDRVVSFTVFEHVEHPFAALAELHRILAPGGLAWIKANLYRGPKASHRYRWVHFPFPHLLFTDDVFREYSRRHGLQEAGAAWVNRLSWADYEAYVERIGFRIRMLRFQVTPLDEAFYARFEDVLGRYPRTDLSRDFFEVVLEKVPR